MSAPSASMSRLNLDHPNSTSMSALLALDHDGPIAREMQSREGLEFYRAALDKLVKLGFATRSGERGKLQWTITDLGRERVARWREEQGL